MKLTMRIVLGLVLFFLLAPILAILAVAFSPSPVFALPLNGFSLRWFERIGTLQGLGDALLLTFEVAAATTAFSLVVGTLAAIGITRGTFPGRQALASALISPLMLPGLVIGIAILQYFRMLGLREALPALLLAHVIITLPYVVRTVLAGLTLFDFTLVDAARTLGYSYPMALIKVMLPALAPSFITGGLFAFLASVDNYPVSIFLTDVRHKTLPIQMLQYLDESPDPTIAAISAVIIAATILLLIVGDRMVGLRKLAAL